MSRGALNSRLQCLLRPAPPIGLQARPLPVTLDLQFDKFHSIDRLKNNLKLQAPPNPFELPTNTLPFFLLKSSQDTMRRVYTFAPKQNRDRQWSDEIQYENAT